MPEEQLSGGTGFVLMVVVVHRAARGNTHRLQLKRVPVEGRKMALEQNSFFRSVQDSAAANPV